MPKVVIPAIERFLLKINVVDSGCWEWTGCSSHGYGLMKINSKMIGVHRFIYEYFVGKINHALQLDHLCRNRKCANPDHLEQVTLKENLRRGINHNRNKTHCIHGHELTPENTYGVINPRKCRTCRIQRCVLYREKLKYNVP